MGGGGGGGCILASDMHIPNLLKNYPMKLHKIKTMCTNITPEHVSDFCCLIKI